MFIFLFFGFSILVTYLGLQFSYLKVLSPTFISGFMFSAFSLIYLCTYNTMISDISYKACGLFIAVEFMVMAGEFVGLKFKLKREHNKTINYDTSENQQYFIIIPKYKVYLYTIVALCVALYRTHNFLIFVRSALGTRSIKGFISLMQNARILFITSEEAVYYSGIMANQFVILIEVCSCIFIYIFLNNLVICKKTQFYLLFPLIPDFIDRIITTNRSSFLFLMVTFVAIYLSLIICRFGKRKIKISKRVYLFVLLVLLILFLYGKARNDVKSGSSIGYIQGYSNGMMYAFSHYLDYGLPNESESLYTVRGIYDLFGIQLEKLNYLSSTTFSILGYKTNGYTSLYRPYHDFGVAGMLIFKFINTIIATKILYKFVFYNKKKPSYYALLYFGIAMVFCYFYIGVDDMFPTYIWSPKLLIRYFLYGYLFVKYYLKPENNEYISA